jgi:hypothetical protein
MRLYPYFFFGFLAPYFECAPDDVIAHTRNVFDAAAACENNGVLLQVMSLAWNIGVYLEMICKAYAGDLSKRRVRLFRRRGKHANADAAALRAFLQCTGLAPRRKDVSSVSNELTDCRH